MSTMTAEDFSTAVAAVLNKPERNGLHDASLSITTEDAAPGHYRLMMESDGNWGTQMDIRPAELAAAVGQERAERLLEAVKRTNSHALALDPGMMGWTIGL